jgi:hypothetical protein
VGFEPAIQSTSDQGPRGHRIGSHGGKLYEHIYEIIIIQEELKYSYEDNIKMDLREIWFGDVDWINWDQDRDRWRALVNTVMKLRVP